MLNTFCPRRCELSEVHAVKSWHFQEMMEDHQFAHSTRIHHNFIHFTTNKASLLFDSQTFLVQDLERLKQLHLLKILLKCCQKEDGCSSKLDYPVLHKKTEKECNWSVWRVLQSLGAHWVALSMTKEATSWVGKERGFASEVAPGCRL